MNATKPKKYSKKIKIMYDRKQKGIAQDIRF